MQKIQFSDPACYNLSVKGELSQETLEILSNFFNGRIICEYAKKTTRLEGIVKDQIALCGLLVYLCDLRYILLSVKTMNKHKINHNRKGGMASNNQLKYDNLN